MQIYAAVDGIANKYYFGSSKCHAYSSRSQARMNFRRYGNSPYSVVVVHGGPGAPGEMAYVAMRLSEKCGVVEPLQTARTIPGQVEELHSAIKENFDRPPVLIGHSWGTWLAFMLTARFPGDVRKLILVGAGPFENGADATKTRLSRLTEIERDEASRIIDLMNESPHHKTDVLTFRKFGELMAKADILDPIETCEDAIDFQPDIYFSIWPEAEVLRRDGTLLELGQKIRCSVTAIHGDYDPHPAEGVRGPLERVLPDFKFILLKNCGHYPWREKRAHEEFFRVLFTEIS
jgi:pimeloyl-ACP methyl ester carboxylesterase